MEEKNRDSDILTMLRNNIIFKHALEVAKSDEERAEIENSALKFATDLINIFKRAVSSLPTEEALTRENIIVNERTGRSEDDTKR